MRKKLFISILLLLFFSGFANASRLSEYHVNNGRAALFNEGNPTYSGIVLADKYFKQAVDADKTDKKANFFYAVTRLFVFALEHGSGAEYETLLDVAEDFGISTKKDYDGPITALDDPLEDDDPFTDPPEKEGEYLPPSPPTIPQAGLISQLLLTHFIDLLDDILDNLDVAAGTTNPIAFKLTALEIDDTVDMEIDRGDVLVYKTFIHTMKAYFLTLFAYSVDGIDTAELIQLGTADILRLQRDLIDRYKAPEFTPAFSLISGGAAQLTAAKAELILSIDTLELAYNSITTEPDGQDDDLFSFNSEDLDEFDPIYYEIKETRKSLVQDRPAELSDDDRVTTTQYNFNLIFGSTNYPYPMDLRAILPDFNLENEPVRGSFPPRNPSSPEDRISNPIFNGFLPGTSLNMDMTMEEDFQPEGSVTIPTTTTIQIDGDAADWNAQAGALILDDVVGEHENISPSMDINNGYMAKDSTYLYIAMTLQGDIPSTPPGYMNYQMSLRTYIDHEEHQQLTIEASYDTHYNVWRTQLIKQYNGQWNWIKTYSDNVFPPVDNADNAFGAGKHALARNGNFIELRVPLQDIVDQIGPLDGKFITFSNWRQFSNNNDYNDTYLQISTPLQIEGIVTKEPSAAGTVLIKLRSDSYGAMMENDYVYDSGDAYLLPLLATTNENLLLSAFQDIDGNGIFTTDEPSVSYPISNFDSDIVRNLDLRIDTDEDGYPDYMDAFPDDSTEWEDFDGDGIGDNADPDDDNDDLPDVFEEDNGLDPKDDTGVNGKYGDKDQDGLSNFFEFENNSDPDEYLSVPDSDNDGDQDGEDLRTLIQNYVPEAYCPAPCPGDLNNDEVLDPADIAFFAERFGVETF
ncbi:MAG: hypothetical protein GY699_23760 [Desulfobacteraceae bacterium]|nr:hypothetical protein [Desulfobacteraceae bacterium]